MLSFGTTASTSRHSLKSLCFLCDYLHLVTPSILKHFCDCMRPLYSMFLWLFAIYLERVVQSTTPSSHLRPPFEAIRTVHFILFLGDVTTKSGDNDLQLIVKLLRPAKKIAESCELMEDYAWACVYQLNLDVSDLQKAERACWKNHASGGKTLLQFLLQLFVTVENYINPNLYPRIVQTFSFVLSERGPWMLCISRECCDCYVWAHDYCECCVWCIWVVTLRNISEPSPSWKLVSLYFKVCMTIAETLTLL